MNISNARPYTQWLNEKVNVKNLSCNTKLFMVWFFDRKLKFISELLVWIWFLQIDRKFLFDNSGIKFQLIDKCDPIGLSITLKTMENILLIFHMYFFSFIPFDHKMRRGWVLSSIFSVPCQFVDFIFYFSKKRIGKASSELFFLAWPVCYFLHAFFLFLCIIQNFKIICLMRRE